MRRFVTALVSCAFAASGWAAPNILLIYVDDLGYGDLGSYGHPVIETPALDALAARGVRLTNYYAPSALCSPSRAALLTGRHPYRTGIRSWIPPDSNIYLRREEITLAEILQARGYRTALIGKWHLNSDLGNHSEPQPRDQGFSYAYGHNAYQIPTNHKPTNVYRNGELLPAQNGYTADLYADEAIRWLEQEEERPFFLFLSMAEPHTTIANPPRYNARYAEFTRGEIVPIPSGLPEPPIDLLEPRGPGEYYANVTYMDAQIGRVLDVVPDDTIIVFASDNGPVTSDWFAWYEVNAYGSTGGLRGRKHLLYDGGIKVPAIVVVPGVTEAGSVSEALVVGTDWFATLLAATGARVPADRAIDSVNILPALRGAELADRDMLWALDAQSDLEFAFRRDNWKLLLDRSHEPRELYNLERDPLELFNVIDSQASRARTMQQGFSEAYEQILSDPLRPAARQDS